MSSTIAGWEDIMPIKVTREQFEVRENEVVHKPTGATFGARPDEGKPSDINSGLAGGHVAIGKDFDVKEIERVAEQLLAERLHARD
jgi:hypothetical protein